MARRTESVVIAGDKSRDAGGVFVIEEMAAIPATELCLRAMQLVARGGVDVPPHIFTQGWSGFIVLGVGAVITGMGKAPWFEVKPLLDELLTCVRSYQPPGAVMPITKWSAIAGQIEEPETLFRLYEEVVSLHLGFSLAAWLSTLKTQAAMMMAASMQNTETSTQPSGSSSEAASPP